MITEPSAPRVMMNARTRAAISASDSPVRWPSILPS
jgi:hypothetical protein